MLSNTCDRFIMSCRTSMSPVPRVGDSFGASVWIRELWTDPNWESTHAVTSLGSDKLVVPEEKMADLDGPLSDEEKVISAISPRSELRWGTLMLEFCASIDGVSGGSRQRPTLLNVEEIQASARRAGALIIFSSTSALCEPLTKAPCTVLTQNRCRVLMRNSHKLHPRPIFTLCTCLASPVPLVSCVIKFLYTKHRWLLI